MVKLSVPARANEYTRVYTVDHTPRAENSGVEVLGLITASEYT